MDTSFTFVTALTPATGKTKGAPKFSKLSSEKLKESMSGADTTKNMTHICRPSISKPFYKFTFGTNTSSISQKTTNDSIPSLKSCSDSLHLSDRSLSDHEKSPPSKKSDTQIAFKKIIQEVHAGLERITFRKKKTQKSVTKPGTDSFDNCLQQLTSIRIGNTAIKSKARKDDCDKISDMKSSSTEELDNLRDKMLDLSIEKPKPTRTSKPKNKTINKKLFNSTLVVGDESRSIQIVDDVVSVPSTAAENTPFGSDSSGIISEDISPIARLSIAPLTNVYLDSDHLPTPTNFLDAINTKTSTSIQITDKVESKEISVKDKLISKTTKPRDNKKKARKVLSELNDFEEKPTKNDEIKGKQKENSVRPRARKTKPKKDSFIASDTSSTIENESMTLYHKFIAQNIKFDVIKTTTPRSKYKNNPDFHDDGIFTSCIIGKRSSSDDSFSENEEEPEVKNRVKKSRLSSDDEDAPPNVRKSLLSSLSSLSDNEKNKASVTDLEALPKENDKKPKKLQPKKTKPKKIIRLNISSDSSNSSPNSPKSDTIDLTSSPSFTPKSSSTKKKITPITFKLKNLKKLTPARPPKQNKEPQSFLRSLSSSLTSPNSIHPDAKLYKKSFKKLKDELARKLFTLYNKEVFENKLPADLKIEWSSRLRTTSGLCRNRRIKSVITENKECQRVSIISLSTKIIECPDRLRDTLIHELCHAATWIVDNKADGHGPFWSAWANKAMRRFPELPPIKRCHNYAIQTKFKYRCVNCGYTIGRHSKSLNLERKRCGYCYGKFELLLNYQKGKAGVTNTSPRNVQVRPLSRFALFVKDNYGKIKSENTGMKHGDIMKMLSKNFAETKI